MRVVKTNKALDQALAPFRKHAHGRPAATDTGPARAGSSAALATTALGTASRIPTVDRRTLEAAKTVASRRCMPRFRRNTWPARQDLRVDPVADGWLRAVRQSWMRRFFRVRSGRLGSGCVLWR